MARRVLSQGSAARAGVAYAASRLTSIEINGTFYRTQTPATFRKWAAEVPDGFVFAVKGHQRVTHRRELKDAGESIAHFLNSGVLELGDRLGPLLWQFPPTKAFDPADFEGFLALLPKEFLGHRLRHVVEVRHNSFCVPEFVQLLRKFDTPVVFSEHDRYPAIADVTGDFLYLRLQKGDDAIDTGYPPAAIADWAGRIRTWLAGGVPADLPHLDDAIPRHQAAGHLRVFHPRGQSARPGRRHGADRNAEIMISLRRIAGCRVGKSPCLGEAAVPEPAAILPTRITHGDMTAWAKSPEAMSLHLDVGQGDLPTLRRSSEQDGHHLNATGAPSRRRPRMRVRGRASRLGRAAAAPIARHGSRAANRA